MGAVYKGRLELDKVVGIRHDLGQRITKVPVKKPVSLPTSKKSMKLARNTTKDGKQF